MNGKGTARLTGSRIRWFPARSDLCHAVGLLAWGGDRRLWWVRIGRLRLCWGP
jgi:hypothetical protein